MALTTAVPAMAARHFSGYHGSKRHGHHLLTSKSQHHGRQAYSPRSSVLPLANTVWDNPKMPVAVASAILAAASETGVDPHLLAALAWRESRFNPTARNRLSSAAGLLQFTSGTWLRAVKEFGAQHCPTTYAAEITKGANGALFVRNAHDRAAIMQLRNDPVCSAALAADTIREQRDVVAKRLRRDVSRADLYLLHVLGPSGAGRFLDALAEHSTASSRSVVSRHILLQAGLLTREGHSLTIGKTYAAVETMLADQRKHSELLLAGPAPAEPLEVSSAP
ncbi:MAG: transglycosylase SLT domain-containing protein [Janthinobacterium lividum]